ncbi:endolytic transglycosylase MltG, partial [bacterium]|nr:endolytic transglycosylase MltG [bacterium]
EISGLWWQDNRLTPREQALKVLTMASIVEKEAKRDQDRAKIASVFVNRLEKNMPLQSDATIHYFLDDWSRPLTKKDTQRDSPYNTYKNTGLPPAPICNPGRKSMVAAMRPEKTDYIFFISQPDGSIKFTTNHRDHVNLKNEMKRNGDL